MQKQHRHPNIAGINRNALFTIIYTHVKPQLLEIKGLLDYPCCIVAKSMQRDISVLYHINRENVVQYITTL